MSEEQPIFKVTDRRLFNADGTPRETERTEETKTDASAGENQPSASAPERESAAAAVASSNDRETATAGASPAATAETSAAAAGESAGGASAANELAAEETEEFPEDDYSTSDIPGADDPASFINFLMSIASNAAAALGMMEHPVTGERRVDPELARHWIDVLGMLQQKTRGNLAPQEQQIFEGLLADLRMQFVSVSGSRQPNSPRGFTGSDITGGR
jgi:DNA replication initiation complex subunit (GINS family)